MTEISSGMTIPKHTTPSIVEPEHSQIPIPEPCCQERSSWKQYRKPSLPMSDTTDVMDAMHSQAVCSPFQDLCMSDTSTEATSPQSATTLQEVGLRFLQAKGPECHSNTTSPMSALHSITHASTVSAVLFGHPESMVTTNAVSSIDHLVYRSDSSSVHSIETPLQINFHQEQNPDDVGLSPDCHHGTDDSLSISDSNNSTGSSCDPCFEHSCNGMDQGDTTQEMSKRLQSIGFSHDKAAAIQEMLGSKTAASTPNLCLSSPWQSQLKRRVPVGMLASELPISHSRPSQRYSVDTVNTRLHTNRKRFANQCVSDTSIRRSTGDLNLGVNSSNTGSHYTTSCKSGQMCYREMDEFVEWCEEMTGNMFNHYPARREVSMPSYSSILQLAAIEESSESLSRSESLTRGSISTQNTSSISSEGGTSDEKKDSRYSTAYDTYRASSDKHLSSSTSSFEYPSAKSCMYVQHQCSTPPPSAEDSACADLVLEDPLFSLTSLPNGTRNTWPTSSKNKPKMSTSTVVKRLFSFGSYKSEQRSVSQPGSSLSSISRSVSATAATYVKTFSAAEE
ncbi:hypothetical protein MT418_004566 [Batrachochytrium dendrobatidis]